MGSRGIQCGTWNGGIVDKIRIVVGFTRGQSMFVYFYLLLNTWCFNLKFTKSIINRMEFVCLLDLLIKQH